VAAAPSRIRELRARSPAVSQVPEALPVPGPQLQRNRVLRAQETTKSRGEPWVGQVVDRRERVYAHFEIRVFDRLREALRRRIPDPPEGRHHRPVDRRPDHPVLQQPGEGSDGRRIARRPDHLDCGEQRRLGGSLEIQ
jgi:hypothetical protein